MIGVKVVDNAFIHSVVVVMQTPNSFQGLSYEFHNFEIHIGGNSNYQNNPVCPGGPWM